MKNVDIKFRDPKKVLKSLYFDKIGGELIEEDGDPVLKVRYNVNGDIYKNKFVKKGDVYFIETREIRELIRKDEHMDIRPPYIREFLKEHYKEELSAMQRYIDAKEKGCKYSKEADAAYESLTYMLNEI